MKIAILTLGSRGDVQPYVALGRGLQDAGHDITLVTAEQFGDFVTAHGVAFAPVDRRFLELTDTSAGKAAFEGGNRMGLFKMVMPVMRQIFDDCWEAVQGADAIIYHIKMLAGYHLAEKMGIPAIKAMPLPTYPTAAFTNPIAGRELPVAFRRMSYALNDFGKIPFIGIINDFRQKTLSLPKRGRFAAEDRLPNGDVIPVLHAYSPHVVPVPPDWPPHVVTTGYWHLESDSTWQPPEDLVDFLAGGPPPVYIGFGSMLFNEPEAKSRIVVEALQRAGQRGIVAAGWGGLTADSLPDTIHLIDQAPHDWLFPRMAAVVHHGGAGTTAVGLRAGKPTIVVPFFGDQSFWGNRVHTLGTGPAPIPQKKLTAEGLANAIRQATTDPAIQRAASDAGEVILAEDGVARAVEFIETQLAGRSNEPVAAARSPLPAPQPGLR